MTYILLYITICVKEERMTLLWKIIYAKFFYVILVDALLYTIKNRNELHTTTKLKRHTTLLNELFVLEFNVSM